MIPRNYFSEHRIKAIIIQHKSKSSTMTKDGRKYLY